MAEPFVGEIRFFSFGIIPNGWAPCNGQTLQINTNQALYSILGNRFGGDGRTTFALPNLQGRTPVNVSNHYSIGTVGGDTTHTLTLQEIPEHTHQPQASLSAATLPNPSGKVWGTTPDSAPIYASTANTTMSTSAISVTGASQPHSNMQPYTTVSFCIALTGIYPPRS